jgi:hypothetical protein
MSVNIDGETNLLEGLDKIGLVRYDMFVVREYGAAIDRDKLANFFRSVREEGEAS